MEKVRNAINVVIFFALIAFIANSLFRLVLFYLHSPQTP
jgi:hypothetical protein